ncbi:MAG TPA: thioredoxin family protein, partial [bacterium]|nr:thioredoxin family protein [bacterium]
MDLAPIFTPYSFQAAREIARAGGKFLVVDVMATWCGPCKEMDRTTFRDDSVVTWVRSHAIAIQVDAQKEREVASALGVRAFPTIVAWRDGRILGSAVGYQSAESLLDWLEFVRTGETASQRLRRSVNREHDMEGRLRFARALLREGHLDEALEEYIWLWENGTK